MKKSLKHIIVGMSGGVDSSVAALLLKKEGHRVEGVFMKNWEESDSDECPASIDAKEAEAVCDKLKIELNHVNFAEEYWTHVFSHFLDEYRAGRTPNPDILCNKEIKFKAFLDYAKQRGADGIATGHYARKMVQHHQTHLLKGLDPTKDQSYFLYGLNQDQLAHSLFPLGELTKKNVRRIAKESEFENHNKKDSTGICFIGERKFKPFLNQFLPTKKGNIETTDGEIIGLHDGLMFYTIGQRQGLRIGGRKNTHDSPWYVAKKDLTHNKLIVVQGHDHPLLYQRTLFAKEVHWINELPHSFPFKSYAKTRYRQPDEACIIEQITKDHYKIDFAEHQRAITSGQSIVFYQDAICLGGGIIE